MPKPTFTRRQLGRRLRKLREDAGLSTRQVEETEVIGSARTLARLEQGYSVQVTFPVIGALCDEYGTSSELKAELQRMFREVGTEGWWEPYAGAMIKNFSLFVELEQYAAELLIYEPDVVTGLLQTERYAQSLHEKDEELDERTVRQSVELRMRRQADFWGRTPLPKVKIVTWETALRGTACDDEQMNVLRERADLSGVDIRVLSIAEGPYPDVRGPFTVLTFADPEDSDVVYTESIGGSRYEEKVSILEAHRKVFGKTFNRARPLKEI